MAAAAETARLRAVDSDAGEDFDARRSGLADKAAKLDAEVTALAVGQMREAKALLERALNLLETSLSLQGTLRMQREKVDRALQKVIGGSDWVLEALHGHAVPGELEMVGDGDSQEAVDEAELVADVEAEVEAEESAPEAKRKRRGRK